jgi:predicted RNase H-like HicB family nuclease
VSERLEARYPAVLEPQENGALLVRFVDLDDTFTEGDTPDEALFNAAEVLSALLGGRLDHDLPVPDPSPAGEGLYLIAPDARTQAALLIPPGARGTVAGRTGSLAANLLALGATAGESPPLPDPAATGKSGGGPGQAPRAGAGVMRAVRFDAPEFGGIISACQKITCTSFMWTEGWCNSIHRESLPSQF